MKETKVTVLMSVYHEPRNLLQESIFSIINQTYTDFEFLIINDGDNKELEKLIKEINDPRIILITNERNMGLDKSLNKGLKIANGKYIVRMDADDISYENRIEKQLDFIENHTQYSIVSTRIKLFNHKEEIGDSFVEGEIEKEDLLRGTPFAHPSMIINKNDLLSIGGYPNFKRVEDYAMAMNMYASGFKGFIMNNVLLKYRVEDENYSNRKFRYRLNDTKARFTFYKKMGIKWYKYCWAFYPIIVGLIPKKLLKMHQKKKFSRSNNGKHK